jgi:formate-dependent nitrite reductase membrane component NrfD
MSEVGTGSATMASREARPASDRYFRRKGRGERMMVERASFRSYYDQPIIKRPTWQARDIASYLFLGGTAGASSALAAAAALSGRPALSRIGRLAAVTGLGGSLYGLIHDLGRPARFTNMLRVFKPTSPMSVGSWLLAAYGPLAGAAALSSVTGVLPALGDAAGLSAGLLGPAVATYTGPLLADTAVPVWHDAHRELPFLFAASAACSAAGVGLMFAPASQAGPARRLALVAAAGETVSTRLMHARLGDDVSEPLRSGRAGRLLKVASALTVGGAALAQTAGRRSRLASTVGGIALVAGSACTRFGIFYAGVRSADDPGYVVRPQRARLDDAARQS